MNGNGKRKLTSSSNFWLVVVVLVAGSFVLSLVQLSRGLHDQLLVSKQNLLSLKEELIKVGGEKEELENQQGDDHMKASRLREKSKTVLEELLSQQRMVKALKFELLAAREDLTSMITNCTGSSRKMRKQFNTTMLALKDMVTSNREYRFLLKKLIDEKAVVENTLEVVQYQAYNISQQSESAKNKLKVAKGSILKQQADINRLGKELEESNSAVSELTAQLEKEKALARKAIATVEKFKQKFGDLQRR